MYLCPANFYVFHDDTHHLQGQKNTLTHLLIVNVSFIYLFTLSRCIDLIKPNGVTAENEAKYEEDDEEDDEGDDDDEYVEYVEDEDEDFSVNPNPLNKKRSIDEVVDKPEEASQGSKKIKA